MEAFSFNWCGLTLPLVLLEANCFRLHYFSLLLLCRNSVPAVPHKCVRELKNIKVESHSTPVYYYTFKVNSHGCIPYCHISKSVVPTEIWNTKLVIVIWDIVGNLYSIFSYLESRSHRLRYKSISSGSSYFAVVPGLIINLLCSFFFGTEWRRQSNDTSYKQLKTILVALIVWNDEEPVWNVSVLDLLSLLNIRRYDKFQSDAVI